MLREYPLLPLLTRDQCVRVFKLANFGPSLVACSTGFSRVTASRWFNGNAAPSKKPALQIVNTLAYKVLRALRHNHYPVQRRRDADLSALDDSEYSKPLAEYTPQELLPKAWLDQLITREEDATP
jgi:hypothetical protein